MTRRLPKFSARHAEFRPAKAAIDALKKSNSKLEKDLAYQATEQINKCSPILESPYMDNSEIKKAYIAAIQSVSYGTADTKKAAQTLYDSMNSTLEDIVE
jgi:oligogalacturonide transport system substrate-binding protein